VGTVENSCEQLFAMRARLHAAQWRLAYLKTRIQWSEIAEAIPAAVAPRFCVTCGHLKGTPHNKHCWLGTAEARWSPKFFDVS
jgi:hypothetical protein